jgi:NAD-dependent deacetylase
MELSKILEGRRRIFVLSGAGISAESGVPTFRGGGTSTVWRGMPFEVLSSKQMVETNLPLVWEWFDYRLGIVGDCQPNAGHVAIANAQESGRFDEFTLVTQNIDGLHKAAGSPAVIELHGNINEARCLGCRHITNLNEIPKEERPPVCPQCGDPMRPNVVLFGEYLPADAIASAQAKAAECDACLVVGTSALVYPANELPMIARRAGALLIEVNPEETVLTGECDVSLRQNSAEVLPEILG